MVSPILRPKNAFFQWMERNVETTFQSFLSPSPHLGCLILREKHGPTPAASQRAFVWWLNVHEPATSICFNPLIEAKEYSSFNHSLKTQEDWISARFTLGRSDLTSDACTIQECKKRFSTPHRSFPSQPRSFGDFQQHLQRYCFSGQGWLVEVWTQEICESEFESTKTRHVWYKSSPVCCLCKSPISILLGQAHCLPYSSVSQFVNSSNMICPLYPDHILMVSPYLVFPQRPVPTCVDVVVVVVVVVSLAASSSHFSWSPVRDGFTVSHTPFW